MATMELAKAAPDRRKKWARAAILWFAVAMLGLTFFSHTLQNRSLPRVVAESPQSGSLVYTLTGSGTVETGEPVSIFTDVHWRVKEVLAEPGDRVEKDQVLLRLDSTPAEDELLDERTRYEKLQLQHQGMAEDLKQALRNGESPATRKLEQQFRTLALDVEIQARRVARLERQIDRYTSVAAPLDGILTEVNVEAGAPVNPGQPLIRMNELAESFTVSAKVDKDMAGHWQTGEKIEVFIDRLGAFPLQGVLQEIRPIPEDADRVELRIELTHDELQGEESARIRAVKPSRPYPVLIPNEAVREDENGVYVLVVKEREGPLGTEYVLERADIVPGESDDQMTVVQNGLLFVDKILTYSSEPAEEGDRVMLAS